jgi:hypothetical protein
MAFASAVAIAPIQMVPKAAVDCSTYITPDATNGNKFFANRNTLLRVKNSNAATRTVTIHVTRTLEGQTVADDTFVVPALTGEVVYTGFSDIFAQNAVGEVWIEFSAVTNVGVQVLQL